MIDYNDLFDAHERQKYDWLKRQPKCTVCDEHIQDEHAYNINGDLICEQCMTDNFRVSTDDFIE